MPHFKGIINVKERDRVWFDPRAQQGLFSVNGSLEKPQICTALVCFGGVGSAEEFLPGELLFGVGREEWPFTRDVCIPGMLGKAFWALGSSFSTTGGACVCQLPCRVWFRC